MSSKNTKQKNTFKSQTDDDLTKVSELSNKVNNTVASISTLTPTTPTSTTVAKSTTTGKKGGPKQEAVATPALIPTPTPEPIAASKNTAVGKKGGASTATATTTTATTGTATTTATTATTPPEPAASVAVPTPVQNVSSTKSATGGKKGSVKQEVALVNTTTPDNVVQAQTGGRKAKVVREAKPAQVQVQEPVHQVQVEVEAEGVEGGVEVDDEQRGGRLRYFKLIYKDEIQGRYCGKKPKQAANKAFSSIIKDFKKNGNQDGGVNVDINFSIRECTRNSRHKEYRYIGKRETLKEPVKVEIANADGSVKEIEYRFHNKLQKAPKA